MFKPDLQNSAFLSSYSELLGSIISLKNRIHYIANNDKNLVDLKQLQTAHHIKFAVTLPYCRDVEMSCNEGEPFINRFTGSFADKLFGKEQYGFWNGIKTISTIITKED